MVRSKQLWVIILLLAALLAGYLVARSQRPSAKSPEMPLLLFADRYANLISRLQFEQARALGTPENARLLDNEIIPYFKALTARSGQARLEFREVKFESSYLIEGNVLHQRVLESLALRHPIGQQREILLEFEVKQQGESFQVLSTRIATHRQLQIDLFRPLILRQCDWFSARFSPLPPL